MSTTTKALMARGFDSHLAANLDAAGYTIVKLKQLQVEKLLALRIPEYLVKKLHAEPRPSISPETVNTLLFESRRTCCICRKPYKSVVIHHINEWADSRDHDESNLVVLCVEHHDLAHTISTLSKNLTPDELRASKERWKKWVKRIDRSELTRLNAPYKSSRWHWLNYPRVFELIRRENIVMPMVDRRQKLNVAGFIAEDGFLTSPQTWRTEKVPQHWFLDFSQGFEVATYLSDVMDELMRQLPILDITDIVNDVSALRAWLRPGLFVSSSMDFKFKEDDLFSSGENHFMRASARKGSVCLSYPFNGWYCMSMTAKGCHMRAPNRQTVVGLVTNITEEAGELQIGLSALGTSPDFQPHHPSQGAWVRGQRHDRR